MRMKTGMVSLVLIVGVIWGGPPAIAQTRTSDTNMQILRDKVRADKKLLVAANVDLTDAEGKDLWPIYDAYQGDLQKINGQLGKLISAYADAYNQNTLTDVQAKMLMGDALAIEEAEIALRKAYADRLARVLPAKKVARYLQIENKIRAIIRYELATEIPLVE